MFLVGALGFAAGSLLCAVARTPGTLLAARVVQGAFGAVMLPQGLGLIKTMFPPREMPLAFGLFGPVMGLAAVGGPLLAGWLIDADLFGTGWRMIFIINLPVALLAVLAGWWVLPEARTARPPRLDLAGMLLVTAAAAARDLPAGAGARAGLAGLDVRDDGGVRRAVRPVRPARGGPAAGGRRPARGARACSAGGRSPAGSSPGWCSSR